MSRPKEFDPETALDKAMQVFWLNGYEATSLGDLIDTMGISKSSFYDTFGSKREIFLSSLDRYAATTLAGIVETLESDMPGRDAIARIFRNAAERFVRNEDPQGCFISNATAEMTAHCPQTRIKVNKLFHRIEDAFEKAVERGQREGAISRRHDPRALARFLVTSLNGLQVVGMADPDSGPLSDTVETVLKTLG
ncbi:MAG: TetR/AcrR family transcriptional regulator [Rhodospirillales bacterium]